MKTAMSRSLTQNRLLLDQLGLRIQAMNPEKLLKKGYVLLEDENNQLISSVKNMKTGQALKMRLSDGQAYATVTEVEEKNNGSQKN
jgi:exodeoxyribonuclease VII large subunit